MSKRRDFVVLILLSAHAKIVDVSHTRYFVLDKYFFCLAEPAIVVELAGGGYVAMAVSVGDRLQVTCDGFVCIFFSSSPPWSFYDCFGIGAAISTLRDSVSPVCGIFSH